MSEHESASTAHGAEQGASEMDDDIPVGNGDGAMTGDRYSLPCDIWRRSNLGWLGSFDDVAEPKSWIIDGLLGVGEVAIVHGPEKIGKTQFVADIAFAIATSAEWFARRALPGACLWIAGEKAELTRKRFFGMQRQRSAGAVPIAVRDGVNLTRETDVRRIIEHAAAMTAETGIPVRMIVFDTLNRVAPGVDENSAGGMGMVFNSLTKIAAATNAAIVVLHHNARGGDGARGSTAITAGADVVIGVSDKAGVRIAELELANDAAPGQRFCFRLRPIELFTVPEHGRLETTVILEPLLKDADAAIGAAPAVPAVPGDSPDQARAADVLQRFQNIQQGGRVHRRDLLKVCRNLGIVSSNEASGAEQLRRALKLLKASGSIDYNANEVWAPCAQATPTAGGASKEAPAVGVGDWANGEPNGGPIGLVGPIGVQNRPIGPEDAA